MDFMVMIETDDAQERKRSAHQWYPENWSWHWQVAGDPSAGRDYDLFFKERR